MDISPESQKELDLQASYTAQEHLFIGSTPTFPQERPFFLVGDKFLKIPQERQPFIPQGLIYGHQITLERAMQLRKETGYFISRPMGSRLGLRDVLPLAIKFEELHQVTGESLQNPTVLGVFNEETQQVEQLQGRDLNKEAYDMIKHIRDTATFGEYMDLILNPRPKDVGKEFEEFIIEEDEGENRDERRNNS